MNLKLSRPLAVIDTETTGLDPTTDRIVELAILTLRPDGERTEYVQRFDPCRPIPSDATMIHGIADADVIGLRSFRLAAEEVADRLADCDLAGYNLIRFDLRLLCCEFARAGVPFAIDGRRLLDPCAIFHSRERRDLTAALWFYCALDHDGAHGALADAIAAADVLDAQVAHYSYGLGPTAEELHAASVGPGWVDLDMWFRRGEDGTIAFARGRHQGVHLAWVARNDPGYLSWIRRQMPAPDTVAIIRAALEAAAASS